eukprot:TRINITY_DN21808_c0_g1_i1.p1 TRINITY_DN21808_c0_g1~~TRINITY_DN21808_c0_g1_i1.p1  ORF type:complete len:534 (-),score=106.75 TRINITY_DN21808_c0_g1_i1:366-1967(-)
MFDKLLQSIDTKALINSFQSRCCGGGAISQGALPEESARRPPGFAAEAPSEVEPAEDVGAKTVDDSARAAPADQAAGDHSPAAAFPPLFPAPTVEDSPSAIGGEEAASVKPPAVPRAPVAAAAAEPDVPTLDADPIRQISDIEHPSTYRPPRSGSSRFQDPGGPLTPDSQVITTRIPEHHDKARYRAMRADDPSKLVLRSFYQDLYHDSIRHQGHLARTLDVHTPDGSDGEDYENMQDQMRQCRDKVFRQVKEELQKAAEGEERSGVMAAGEKLERLGIYASGMAPLSKNAGDRRKMGSGTSLGSLGMGSRSMAMQMDGETGDDGRPRSVKLAKPKITPDTINEKKFRMHLHNSMLSLQEMDELQEESDGDNSPRNLEARYAKVDVSYLTSAMRALQEKRNEHPPQVDEDNFRAFHRTSTPHSDDMEEHAQRIIHAEMDKHVDDYKTVVSKKYFEGSEISALPGNRHPTPTDVVKNVVGNSKKMKAASMKNAEDVDKRKMLEKRATEILEEDPDKFWPERNKNASTRAVFTGL